MKELSGTGASPGTALGRARGWHDSTESTRTPERIGVGSGVRPSGTPQEEWRRLEVARSGLLASLRARATGGDVAAELFAAHADILNDLSLVEMLQECVQQDKASAEAAVETTFGEFVALFSALDDPLFAARANDVRDLQMQVLALLARPADSVQIGDERFPAGTILLADDLMPSQVARLDPARVVGIALAHGSRLAHAAILARSMGIPVVCQLGETLLAEAAGLECLIDGDEGRLVLEPDAGVVSLTVLSPEEQRAQATSDAVLYLTGVQQTCDGVAVAVMANLNTPRELEQIARQGADGIGLLRTEFLFAREQEAPSVTAQAERYSEILWALGDAPIYVRAFDFGGDKRMAWRTASFVDDETELRGVRFLLAHPDLLRDQYLALLQAVQETPKGEEASRRRVRYLLPMIALPEEIDIVRSFLDEIAAAEGLINSGDAIEIGAMIEIPSAALMAGEIASRCEMISIGSNDLAQFLFAGDRSQRDAAALADALHPAALRTIRQICQAAAFHNCPVSLCGEMAGNPLATPLLLGLGVNEVSVTPSATQVVKAAVGRYTLEECRTLAEAALAAPDLRRVREILTEFAA